MYIPGHDEVEVKVERCFHCNAAPPSEATIRDMILKFAAQSHMRRKCVICKVEFKVARAIISHDEGGTESVTWGGSYRLEEHLEMELSLGFAKGRGAVHKECAKLILHGLQWENYGGDTEAPL